MKPALTYPEWKAAEEDRRARRGELYAAWTFVVILGLLGVVGLIDMAVKAWRAL